MRLEYWMAEEIAEAEREELERAARRQRNIDVAVEVVYVASLVIAFATVALLIWRACTADLRDRAAYNEGYYGVDHQTALELAKQGIGKSAEDILK